MQVHLQIAENSLSIAKINKYYYLPKLSNGGNGDGLVRNALRPEQLPFLHSVSHLKTSNQGRPKPVLLFREPGKQDGATGIVLTNSYIVLGIFYIEHQNIDCVYTMWLIFFISDRYYFL